jgi:hypothetical protein
MEDMAQTGTELALPAATDLLDAFRAPDHLDSLIGRIESEARSQVIDLSTAKGRAACASLAFKIAKSKTALDSAGKALNEQARAHINKVDAERRRAWDRLEKLQAEIRAPLTEWESAEKARVDAIKARIERLRTAHESVTHGTAEQIGALLARVEVTAIDDTWAEFTADAARFKDQAIATLRNMHAIAAEREAQAAELARLRAEADARAEADRKRAEAEAAEQSRLAAEKAEADRAAWIEREKQEAAAAAAKEAEAHAKAAAEQAAKEAADREARLLAELKAEQDRTERAAQAERDRMAAEAKAEADAMAKRKADTAHRARIQAAIAEALEAYMAMGAMGVADAIIGGAIPHVKAVL